jgi:hypothetical protein
MYFLIQQTVFRDLLLCILDNFMNFINTLRDITLSKYEQAHHGFADVHCYRWENVNACIHFTDAMDFANAPVVCFDYLLHFSRMPCQSENINHAFPIVLT